MKFVSFYPCQSFYSSIYTFQPNLLIYQQNFHHLNLREKDIGEFYKIFQQIDTDHDGYIQYFELFKVLDYETTKFSIHIFDVYDLQKVGMMNFQDFVFITWNFCTIEKMSLERFIFDLYDFEDHGILDILVVHQIFKEIYGREFLKNYQIQRSIKGLTQSLRGSTIISAESFHSFCRKNGTILSPVLSLQTKLRSLVLGVEFWKRQTRNRVEICDGTYIPFSKLLKQISEGRRDRARRASLLELTVHLTQQLRHPHDILNEEISSSSSSPSPSPSSSISFTCCLFPSWCSSLSSSSSPSSSSSSLPSSKTHPEINHSETNQHHHPSSSSSWRISLTEHSRIRPLPSSFSNDQTNENTESETTLHQKQSSVIFDPEEPLDEDVEALLTKQLSQRKTKIRQPKYQPRSNPASEYMEEGGEGEGKGGLGS